MIIMDLGGVEQDTAGDFVSFQLFNNTTLTTIDPTSFDWWDYRFTFANEFKPISRTFLWKKTTPTTETVIIRCRVVGPGGAACVCTGTVDTWSTGWANSIRVVRLSS
jgi:hypothetical protein